MGSKIWNDNFQNNKSRLCETGQVWWDEFTCWKDKLMFLLTALKIAYVLDPSYQNFLNHRDIDQVKAECNKHEEDEVVRKGHILNTLSNCLYDLFTSMKSPNEIWEALEFKYKTEKQGVDKFLIMKYFEFAMVW